MEATEKLREVISFIRDSFVGKDDVVEMLALTLVARENAFLLGPPGTAKSAIVKLLASCISVGKNFEYLLTRFTEPNEIFGPFDIRKLKEGELVTNTEGMMPEASLVFLDEIFNANSAILNSLLMALNEKIFRRGKETRKLPALMFVGASNQLPEDESLNALLDRFLVRIECDYADPDQLGEVLISGWKLENQEASSKPQITSAEIKIIQQQSRMTDLSAIRKPYVDLVHNLRNTGIKVSDRRAVKLQSLIAASAYMSNRKKAVLSDLWVLKYIWDTEEQVEILEALVNNVIGKEDTVEAHPQAFTNKVPDAEDLVREVLHLKTKWGTEGLSPEEQNVVKDKLRYVQTRSNWITNELHRQHIQTEIDGLWQSILQAV